jgi:hypothetical protein
MPQLSGNEPILGLNNKPKMKKIWKWVKIIFLININHFMQDNNTCKGT